MVKAVFVAEIIINHAIRKSPRIDAYLWFSESEAKDVIHHILCEPGWRCSKSKVHVQHDTCALVRFAIFAETPVIAVERFRAATAVPGRDKESTVLAVGWMPDSEETGGSPFGGALSF